MGKGDINNKIHMDWGRLWEWILTQKCVWYETLALTILNLQNVPPDLILGKDVVMSWEQDWLKTVSDIGHLLQLSLIKW
jgi:hypothetical protein